MTTSVSSYPQVQLSMGKPASASIVTEDLVMRPVTQADAREYHERLFGNRNVMANTTGELKDLQSVEERVSLWVSRWREGDPFSGFCINEKATGVFVGHGILGHGSQQGVSEMAILTTPEYWTPKYQIQIGKGLLAYARILVGAPLQGSPFTTIEATARVDQVAMNKILSSFAGKPVAEEVRHGAPRNVYRLVVANEPPVERAVVKDY